MTEYRIDWRDVPPEPATPPAAPTVAARREAAHSALQDLYSRARANASAQDTKQQTRGVNTHAVDGYLDAVAAELTRLWAIEDAARATNDAWFSDFSEAANSIAHADAQFALRAALKGAEQ